jgi:hypothetical protein
MTQMACYIFSRTSSTTVMRLIHMHTRLLIA